ncbi:MAG: hypothetical protein H6582_10195 [Crocinitomicaceae bacterium]|nr:hypothetical protein [Crocinitomicaceae bacterium]
MKKITLSLCAITLSIASFSQNNVGIGTTTPDASSALEVNSSTQGLLVPRIALTATNVAAPVTSPATSLLVYNTATAGTVPNNVTPGYYYWDGSAWARLNTGSGSTSCVTLDEAYDCTTPGGGRIITVNNGSIEFNQTAGTNTEVLTVTSTQGTAGTPVDVVSVQHSGVGNAIFAENSNATANQDFPAVVGSVTNSVTANYGVLGVYDGTSNIGAGGAFQAISTDGGIGMFSINGSPSATQTNFGGYSFSLGGSANNYGFQGVVGNGSGTVNSYSSTDVTTAGLYGYNESTTGGAGVYGYGVQGLVGLTDYANAFAIYGKNFGGFNSGNIVGILGDGGYGVWGQTEYIGGVGAYGLCAPLGGTGSSGAGLLGEATDVVNDWAIFGIGDLGITGTKSFVIDHPEDPSNKILKHFCLESDEVLNVYRGSAQFDANGVATVELPSYFDDININFTYQLTPVGAPSPGMYVSKEIQGTQFEISGGAPNAKVSWTVYAERNDKYIQENPGVTQVEVDKSGNQVGKYLDPSSHGQDRSNGIFQGGEIKNIEGGSDQHGTTKKEIPVPNLNRDSSNNSNN